MLYEHQQKIINEDPKKCGLWLSCGSGKTRTALHLARGKTLVICLKAQRDDKTWEEELEEIKIPLDLTVLSKEDFRSKWKDLPKFDTVIVDEATSCLGVTPNVQRIGGVQVPKTSQLFQCLKKYVEYHNPERIYLVTATISKAPFCVWAAGVILGEFKYNTFFDFRDIYYFKLPMGGWREVYKPKDTPELQERLSRVINRLGYVGRLEDYFDVPDQNFHTDYLELTTDQKKALKQMELDFPDPMIQIGKRHQIENGVLKGDKFVPDIEIKDNKIEKILDYAFQFPKMIIFAKFTMQIEKIKKALEFEGYDVYTRTGKTKDAKEQSDKLKQLDRYVYIVQGQISKGWELPDCPVVLFASNVYPWEDYEQSLGRVQRSHNVKKNLYIHLVTKHKKSTDMAVLRSIKSGNDFKEVVHLKNEKKRS